MKKRIVALSLIFVMLLSCVCHAEDMAQSFAKEVYTNYLESFIDAISKNFYYGVEKDKLYQSAIKRMISDNKFNFGNVAKDVVESLDDKYAEYYSPEEYRTYMQALSGSFGGIGVTIFQRDNELIVQDVYEGLPAATVGILPNDIIYAIDGKLTDNMTSEEAAQLVRGVIGTAVNITVKRGEELLSFDVIRDVVGVSPISVSYLDDGKIAYIWIKSFMTNLGEYLEPAMKEIDEKKIKKVIIDLRDNGGGEIGAALTLSKYFIPNGVFARIHYKDKSYDETLYSENKSTSKKYKLAVLCNSNSASASELFLGAVKDRNAGKIIGERTYTKGSVQMLFNLINGAGMKYTVAEFYSPNNKRINTIGIKPDIEVENEIEKIEEESFSPLSVDFDFLGVTDNSKQTLAIEERLTALDYMEEADGIFDDKTTEAIKLFQTDTGLTQSGTPDLYTLIKLNDIDYHFEKLIDKQLEKAIEYLNK